eukprot:2338022-Amphidinium_carterae.1
MLMSRRPCVLCSGSMLEDAAQLVMQGEAAGAAASNEGQFGGATQICGALRCRTKKRERNLPTGKNTGIIFHSPKYVLELDPFSGSSSVNDLLKRTTSTLNYWGKNIPRPFPKKSQGKIFDFCYQTKF